MEVCKVNTPFTGSTAYVQRAVDACRERCTVELPAENHEVEMVLHIHAGLLLLIVWHWILSGLIGMISSSILIFIVEYTLGQRFRLAGTVTHVNGKPRWFLDNRNLRIISERRVSIIEIRFRLVVFAGSVVAGQLSAAVALEGRRKGGLLKHWSAGAAVHEGNFGTTKDWDATWEWSWDGGLEERDAIGHAPSIWLHASELEKGRSMVRSAG